MDNREIMDVLEMSGERKIDQGNVRVKLDQKKMSGNIVSLDGNKADAFLNTENIVNR